MDRLNVMVDTMRTNRFDIMVKKTTNTNMLNRMVKQYKHKQVECNGKIIQTG